MVSRLLIKRLGSNTNVNCTFDTKTKTFYRQRYTKTATTDSQDIVASSLVGSVGNSDNSDILETTIVETKLIKYIPFIACAASMYVSRCVRVYNYICEWMR